MSLLYGLHSHFRCEEGSGVTRASSTGVGNLYEGGTAVATVAGKQGTAAYISGSNFLWSPAAETIDLNTGSFTFGFWFYISATPAGGNYPCLMAKGERFSSKKGLMLFVNGDDGGGLYSEYSVNGSAVNYQLAPGGVIPPLTWCYTRVWWDADAEELGLSYNANADTVASVPGGLFDDGTTRLSFGSAYVDFVNSPLTGGLDEISVHTRRLSLAEESYRWNGGAGRSYPEMVADARKNQSSLLLGV